MNAVRQPPKSTESGFLKGTRFWPADVDERPVRSTYLEERLHEGHVRSAEMNRVHRRDARRELQMGDVRPLRSKGNEATNPRAVAQSYLEAFGQKDYERLEKL